MAFGSSDRNQRIDPDLVFIGEIGLSGELRSVSQIERRLSEAAKLGFQRALTPILTQSGTIDNLEIHPTRSLAEVVALMTRVQAAS
jgi:DNA repair protein RadA/Sms